MIMASFWNNRTAFVTGATGFVGAHVARMLVEQGARVVCLQRDAVRANSLDLFDLRRRATVIQGTVEDLPLMERILSVIRRHVPSNVLAAVQKDMQQTWDLFETSGGRALHTNR